MKRVLFFNLILILALFSQASFSYAQGEDLMDAEKKLDESIADLLGNEEVLDERTKEEVDAENAEIAKRVAAFEAVLSFTEEELVELSSKFDALEYEFGDELWDFHKAIRKHFIAAKSERSSFSSRVVSNDSRLEDIKALALEFKEWRENIYDAKNRAFFDFLI
jgi:hypothetical protein